jgi:glycosyltransferase involved in cell wall biosynthesis
MIRGLRYVSGMGNTGYFTAARRLILALANAGVNLTWTPVAGYSRRHGPKVFPGAATGDPALDPFCHRKLECDTVILHTLPELMPYWLDRKGDKRIVGYTVWETDVLQAHWVPILNRLDHLLVPCTWNRDLFRGQGVRVPISVLPHLPGPARPAPHPRWAAIPEGDLVFYCIETWSVRKNLEQAITLFRQCFTAADGVRLVVKTSPWPEGGVLDRWPSLRPLEPLRTLVRPIRKLLPKRASALWRENAQGRLRRLEALTPGGAPVDLITEEMTRAEVEGLHQRGDCYFSLTHSEGFGLGPFDAAAAGKPVIVTGWGGVLEYLDPAQGGLVDSDPVPAWNRPESGCWAQPRLSHAAALLGALRADPESARRRAEEAQARLHCRFGAAALIPFLKRVLAHD